MKHITFADKNFFVDDETSDAIVEYCAMLGAQHTADTVRIRGVGGDGNEVEADFVLNSATNLIAETTNSKMTPPQNEEAVRYMRERMDVLRLGPRALPLESDSEEDYDVTQYG
jgi:hypothetical protein